VRPVDRAMFEDRPQKRAVRTLWLEELKRITYRAEDGVPLYLTLPGAEGKDIELLALHGLISLTDVHGIAATDRFKVIAVESSPRAALRLQEKFPGLKIIEARIQDILRGDSPTKWPDKREEILCRARVINLDVDEPVEAHLADESVMFPLLERVRKLALLHAQAHPLDWLLLLSAHGEILWDEAVSLDVQEFLAENCAREAEFRVGLANQLGDKLVKEIEEGKAGTLSLLSQELQQRLLLSFVPKKIVALVQNQCWRVEALWNYYYGGRNRDAPIATWAIAFHVDRRASSRPDTLYREGLRSVFRRVGRIAEDGTIQE